MGGDQLIYIYLLKLSWDNFEDSKKHGFPMISHRFRYTSRISHGFPMDFPWISHGFLPMKPVSWRLSRWPSRICRRRRCNNCRHIPSLVWHYRWEYRWAYRWEYRWHIKDGNIDARIYTSQAFFWREMIDDIYIYIYMYVCWDIMHRDMKHFVGV